MLERPILAQLCRDAAKNFGELYDCFKDLNGQSTARGVEILVISILFRDLAATLDRPVRYTLSIYDDTLQRRRDLEASDDLAYLLRRREYFISQHTPHVIEPRIVDTWEDKVVDQSSTGVSP